jgi:hypothetical protein
MLSNTRRLPSNLSRIADATRAGGNPNSSLCESRTTREVAVCCNAADLFLILAVQAGFEPATVALTGRCSTKLSYWTILTGAGARQSRARSKDKEVRRDFLETPSSLPLF